MGLVRSARPFALAAAVLLLGAIGAEAQRPRRERMRNEDGRREVAAAVARDLSSYRARVRAPNGQEIDLTPVLRRVAEGRSLRDAGFPPHDGDGSVFLNLTDRDAGRRPLPDKPRGYYFEFVVPPNDRARWPGPQRLIMGRGGEAYYSPDHYDPRTIVALHRSNR